MPTKSILSFDWMINENQCKVHVGYRYNYCNHTDAPACGCDLALPFDDASTVEQFGLMPKSTYVVIYPVGIKWPGKKRYHETFKYLVREVMGRLAVRSDYQSPDNPAQYVVLCVEETPWSRHIRYMVGKPSSYTVHIKERKS